MSIQALTVIEERLIKLYQELIILEMDTIQNHKIFLDTVFTNFKGRTIFSSIISSIIRNLSLYICSLCLSTIFLTLTYKNYLISSIFASTVSFAYYIKCDVNSEFKIIMEEITNNFKINLNKIDVKKKQISYLLKVVRARKCSLTWVNIFKRSENKSLRIFANQSQLVGGY